MQDSYTKKSKQKSTQHTALAQATPAYKQTMEYKEIVKLASNVDARDLAIYGLSASKYSRANRRSDWTPISLSIEVTYWCNRRCKGCYIPDEIKRNEPVIEEELLESIVKQTKENEIPFVGFAGGEPLSKKSGKEIYKTLEKNPLTPFFVYTNGDFIPNTRDEIKDHHNLAYIVSLDGLEENHDFIRGKGSFERVTAAFEELKRNKKIYGASVTVRKSSEREIASSTFFEYLDKKGVRFVRIRTLKGINEEINPEESEKIKIETEKQAERYNILISWGGLEKEDAQLPSKDLLVGIDGTVRATRFAMEESFGNLRNKSLKQIIKEIQSKGGKE